MPSGPNAHQRETCAIPARITLLSSINLGEGGVLSPSNTPVYSTPTDAHHIMGRLADFAAKVFPKHPPPTAGEPQDDADEGLTICDALQGALEMTNGLAAIVPILAPVHTACTEILKKYRVSTLPTVSRDDLIMKIILGNEEQHHRMQRFDATNRDHGGYH